MVWENVLSLYPPADLKFLLEVPEASDNLAYGVVNGSKMCDQG
jgi:hypothetical protein